MSGRSPSRGTVAVAGATGFVGTRLVPALARDGWTVRALVRDAERARRTLPDAEVCEVDLASGDGLAEALSDCEHAYFLVHMMGQDDDGDYAEREAAAARTFAAAASAAGVARISYLGGLGKDSPHLSSRMRTAEMLTEHGPPLTSFRAAMVIGPGSESYELMRSIVDRLPVAPSPGWLDNLTQPIGIRDLISYLRRSPSTPEAAGRTVEIGGPKAISHRDVIDTLASELGRDGPIWVPVTNRIAAPGVMAAGAATVTRGNRGIASELAFGLAENTIVEDPSGSALFDVNPERLETSFQRCLEEQEWEERKDG